MPDGEPHQHAVHTAPSVFAHALVHTYTLNPPLLTGAIQTGMFDVNGDGVADLVASANAPGYIGPNSRSNPSGTVIPFALVIDDGATGAPLLNIPYEAPRTGPLWVLSRPTSSPRRTRRSETGSETGN